MEDLEEIVSVEEERRVRVVLVGPLASGKTTLLKKFACITLRRVPDAFERVEFPDHMWFKGRPSPNPLKICELVDMPAETLRIEEVVLASSHSQGCRVAWSSVSGNIGRPYAWRALTSWLMEEDVRLVIVVDCEADGDIVRACLDRLKIDLMIPLSALLKKCREYFETLGLQSRLTLSAKWLVLNKVDLLPGESEEEKLERAREVADELRKRVNDVSREMGLPLSVEKTFLTYALWRGSEKYPRSTQHALAAVLCPVAREISDRFLARLGLSPLMVERLGES